MIRYISSRTHHPIPSSRCRRCGCDDVGGRWRCDSPDVLVGNQITYWGELISTTIILLLSLSSMLPLQYTPSQPSQPPNDIRSGPAWLLDPTEGLKTTARGDLTIIGPQQRNWRRERRKRRQNNFANKEKCRGKLGPWSAAVEAKPPSIPSVRVAARYVIWLTDWDQQHQDTPDYDGVV